MSRKSRRRPVPPRVLTSFDYLCWRVLIWVVGVSTPLMAALKPRRFQVGEVAFVESAAGPSHSATQLLYLFFLAFACVAFARGLGRNGERGGPPRRFWLLTLLLASMPTVSSLVSGSPLQVSLVGALGIYAATYFLKVPPLEWWCREVRVMLLVLYVYGSLAAGLLAPKWAWNLDYAAESSMAVFPQRLFGTTNHANALAPLVVFSWLLGRFPKARLRWEWLHTAATLLVLLLSQSKTNWIIACVLGGTYLLQKTGQLPRWKRFLCYGCLAATAVGALVYLFTASHYATELEDLIYNPEVFTLTGRVPLWLFAIGMWLDAPLLGQGLDAWSSDVLMDLVNLLGWAAPHAHNQILQVLSQSGLVGLAVLVLWVWYFIKIVRGAPDHLRAPLWWLTAFFFMPGFTEVILQYSIGPGNSVLAWLMFSIVMIVGSSRYKEQVVCHES